MARPREFDTDTALAKAMSVFWEHGYADATLPDLLKGMNLTRGSLYKAFKDKKSLFLTVLENYDEQAVSRAVARLVDPEQDGWQRIFGLFAAVTEAVHSGDRRGCLLCSAIAGPAVYDAQIAAFAHKSLDRMTAGFATALEGLEPAEDIPVLAQFLTTQYVGIRVLARTSVSADVLRRNVTALEIMARRG